MYCRSVSAPIEANFTPDRITCLVLQIPFSRLATQLFCSFFSFFLSLFLPLFSLEGMNSLPDEKERRAGKFALSSPCDSGEKAIHLSCSGLCVGLCHRD